MRIRRSFEIFGSVESWQISQKFNTIKIVTRHGGARTITMKATHSYFSINTSSKHRTQQVQALTHLHQNKRSEQRSLQKFMNILKPGVLSETIGHTEQTMVLRT